MIDTEAMSQHHDLLDLNEQTAAAALLMLPQYRDRPGEHVAFWPSAGRF
jgi:hypothetical protein